MFESETIWLTITNIALGVITIICLFAVGRIAYREIAERVQTRASIFVPEDNHAFVLSDLGVTMADGGEPIDERSLLNKQKKEQSGKQEKNV
jgi:hypothetical protein